MRYLGEDRYAGVHVLQCADTKVCEPGGSGGLPGLLISSKVRRPTRKVSNSGKERPKIDGGLADDPVDLTLRAGNVAIEAHCDEIANMRHRMVLLEVAPHR